MTAVALSIAGSDSSAGAGSQADLKTFAALGVHGLSVVTAVTAQGSNGVTAIHDVPAPIIAAQLKAVFSDFAIGAVKIGMVSQTAAITVVAEALERFGARNVVIDPVLAASSGERLLAQDALDSLKQRLLPLATLLTPNLAEASALTATPLARQDAEMRAQGERLLALGVHAVLVKGGHASGPQSVDLLIDGGGSTQYGAERMGIDARGTGCTLASAVAASLAKGLPLHEAVRAGKAYVTAALAAAPRLALGAARQPLHHFHAWW